MPTSFEVIFLGNLPRIDTTQGNEVAENAAALIGSYGTAGNPLHANIGFLTANVLTEDDNSTYDTDNGGGFDSFRINGGPPQNFDAVATYNAVITYVDGTTVFITATVFQDVNGNTYLAPEEVNNTDQIALTAAPILSLNLISLVTATGDMLANRVAGDFITPVDGTAGNDSMGVGFTDAQGDQITTGNDYVLGGDGNDTINAGAGNDTILAGDGNDFVQDTIGNDLVRGGAGSDTINLNLGNDTVFGETGDDAVFVWDFAGTKILDGGSGWDTLGFGNASTSTGVNIDINAGGSGSFTHSTTGTSGTFTSFESFAGTLFNDTIDARDTSTGVSLSGEAGNDSITGGSGADTINAGEGSDIVDAGGGDDLVIVDGAFSGIDTLDGGAGNDTLVLTPADNRNLTVNMITGRVADSVAGDQVFSNFENITTGGGNDSVLGNGGANLIITQGGNDTITAGAGNDTVDGGDGADQIFGDDGDDSLSGGAGNDTIFFGAGNDTVMGGDGDDLFDDAAGSPAGTGNNLIDGGAGNDFSWDASGNDTFFGGEGNDTFVGENGGNDLLFGDAGNDSLSGGVGDDTIFGGEGDDTLIAGTNSGTGDALFGDAGNDRLVDSFGNATLDGGTGSDVFEVGYGIATVIGGEDAGGGDIDRLDFLPANNAVNIQYTGTESGTYTDSDGDSGQFVEIEALTLTNQADTVNGAADTGGIIIAGNGGNDQLTGGQGADSIDGGADNDTIAGGAGNDTLLGGSGLDSIAGGEGDDSINAGSGDDTAEGGAGNDTIDGGLGNDRLIGGDGNDTILGGAGNDTIEGGAGDDLLVAGSYGGAFPTSNDAGGNTNILSGGDGNDTILASVGADTLSGDAGDDSIDGQGGNDLISGGDGRDTLQGGAGADTLTGGTGADVFIVDTGGDLITDFDATTGIEGGGTPDQTDNDFVDLSAYYNETTLAAWNAANPANTFLRPIDWLRADQADGSLAEVGGLQIRDAGGNAVAANLLNFENTNVVCFADGTMIATAMGPVPVEDLRPGDLVMTMDHGLQPLRWIGSRRLGPEDLRRNPNLRPIRLSAAALGLPDATGALVVSPQHRIMIASPIAQRMFGCSEVLVAAKDLLEIDGVSIAEDRTTLSYFHLLFDDHEIVFADGMPAESLYLGQEARKALSPEGLAEIQAIFPEFVAPHFTPASCRPILSGKRARKLGWRHANNRKPLIDRRLARRVDDMGLPQHPH